MKSQKVWNKIPSSEETTNETVHSWNRSKFKQEINTGTWFLSIWKEEVKLLRDELDCQKVVVVAYIVEVLNLDR